MKAVVKTRREAGIEVLDMPMPKIKPNEVLLQVKGCGICGSDLALYDWTEEGRSRRGRPIALPRIIGHEPSGIITEVGAEVKDVKVGDRVASDSWGGCGQCYYCRLGYFNMCMGDRQNIGSLCDGAMAEYCAIPDFNVYKIPDSISFDEAAALEPLGVAMRALETLVHFKPGNDVAVFGPGPIGLLEAMSIRAAGAGKIFVIGRSDNSRLELARQLGFTTINSKKEPVRDIILDATGGMGVDLVFDATSTGIPGEAITLLKAVGQLVISAPLDGPVTFEGKDFHLREVIITTNRARNPSSWYSAINLVASGRVDVKPLITHRFKIEKADTGFQMLKRGEGMKILIVP